MRSGETASSRIRSAQDFTHQASRIPDGTGAEVPVAVVIPDVVEAQSVPIEVADVDPVAVGVHVTTTHIDVLEEALAGGQEQGHDREHDVPCERNFLALRDQSLLLAVGLGRRVLDRLFAEQEPAHTDRNLNKLFAFEPGLTERAVEQTRRVATHLLTDVVDRHREASHEHVGPHAGLERRFVERDLRELRAVTARVLHAKGLLDLVDTEEVGAHDGLRIMVRFRHGDHPLQGFAIHTREPLARGPLQPRLVAKGQ